MVRRVAASLALVVFAVCVMAGLGAGNSSSTILANALLAMGGAFVVGLVIGAMAQRMLSENVVADPAKAPAMADPAAAAHGDEKK
jgi:NhaP-type Na+/H+ or K+/H+ antiporter